MDMKKLFVMAAALALGTAPALAQNGGSGGSAGSGGAGAYGGSGNGEGQAGSPSAGPGSTGSSSTQSGASKEAADQAAMQQKATSARPTEGGGGKVPHPVVEGGKDDPRFSDNPAPPAGPEGRPLYEQGKAGAANQGAVDQANQVSGRIAAVNPTDREIAIDAGSATTQVRLAPDAKITVDGKTATLQDLRPGANVRASLDRSGDMPVVKKLDVTTSKKK
jgi:hypothetical protein